MMILERLGLPYRGDPDGLVAWLETETPYPNPPDEDLSENPYLVIHEIVEIAEVRRGGLRITKDVIVRNMEAINDAHLRAAEVEFQVIASARDVSFLRSRFEDLCGWCKDPLLTPAQRARYESFRSMIEEALTASRAARPPIEARAKPNRPPTARAFVAGGTTDWWERLYRSSEVSQLPWYTAELDRDIAGGLKTYGPRRGRVLDLGTGPGIHAVGLARLGYDVVATDISPSAIRAAKAHARKNGAKVVFRRDNILNSGLPAQAFDAVVDRGTFHVLPPEARPRYAATVHRILRPRGFLFLKTFSDKQPGDEGPYRLSPGELRTYFLDLFDVISIEDSAFQGTLLPYPRALFAILHRR